MRIDISDRQATVLAVLLVCILVVPAGWAISTTWSVGSYTHLETDSGLDVQVNDGTNLPKQPFPDSDTLILETGRIHDHSNDAGSLTLIRLNGTETEASKMEVSSTNVTLSPLDKTNVTVGAGLQYVRYRAPLLQSGSDGDTDMTIQGDGGSQQQLVQVHSFGQTDTRIVAWSLSDNKVLDTATTNSTGFATFVLPQGYHAIDFQKDDVSVPKAVNPRPTNGTWITADTIKINATILNPEGATTVTLRHTDPDSPFRDILTTDLVAQATKEVADGTTVEFTISDPVAGTNEWRLVLEDDDDRVVTEKFTYRTPGGLEVIDGTDGETLDHQQVTAKLSSQESGYSDTLTTSDGFIDFNESSTIPDESLWVNVSSSGYKSRNLSLDDPSKRYYTYMYESSGGGVLNYTQSFAIKDRTADGLFDPENTTLIAERKFDGAWRTVGSDLAGAINRSNITMEDGVTYRLAAENGSHYQIAGKFFADESLNDTVVPVYLDGSGGNVSEPNDTVTDNKAPVVADLRPGGYQANRTNRTVSANVTDPEGASVKVSFYARTPSDTLTQLGTNQTINGTETVNVSVTDDLPLGEGRLFVFAEDVHGETTSKSRYLATPNELLIRNDSTLKLIDDATITAEIDSLDSNYDLNRTTDDGRLDLEDVPRERLDVVLTASGYETRALVITDPTDLVQTTMIPTSSNNETGNQTFNLTDRSGDFPPKNSTLVAKREINGTWQSVTGDDFGLENLANLTLVIGRTYRLEIRNTNNQVYEVGAYTQEQSTLDQTITLVIPADASFEGKLGSQCGPVDNGTSNISTTCPGNVFVSAYLNASAQPPYIAHKYVDRNESTDRLDITIYEYGKPSNVIWTGTFRNLGSLTRTVDITEDQANRSWVVEWRAERGEETIVMRRIVGDNQLRAGASLDGKWRNIIAILSLFVLAGIVGGGADRELGAVVVAVVAAGWHWLGWLPGEVTGLIISGTIFIAVLFHIQASSEVGV